MSPAENDLRRAGTFMEDLQRDLCPIAEPWRWGIDFAHPGLSRVWDLNLLYLNDPPADVGAAAVADDAERIMGARGCEHRRVWVPDEGLGMRLAPGFQQLNWEVDVHVVMSYRHEPERIVDTSMVQEVGRTTWSSREKQLRSYPWTNNAEIVAEMKGLYDLLWDIGIVRDFAVVENGDAVSFAFLFSRGGIGQIEDVATLEAHRRRGLSRAVVYRALQESLGAGNDLTFLVADALDWPKDFYSKLGFEAVGNHYYFLKTSEK